MEQNKYIPKKMREFMPYIPVISDDPERTVHMEANESPFDLPEDIKRTIAEKLMRLEFNRYPDPTAKKLCRAFAAYYGIDEKNAAAGNGSDELIMILSAAFLQKGDKIAVTSPDFSMYGFYSALFENNVRTFEKADGVSTDLKAFARFIKDNGCKAAIFSTPCNPTGTLAGSKEAITEFVRSVDALVIIDEAYMDFSSGSFIQSACDYPNVILLKTLSKGFGLAGARLGFAVANDALINVLKTAKSPYNVNSVSQMIGETVLSHPELLKERHETIKAQRDRIYSYLISKGLDAVKSDANFVFVKEARGVDISGRLKEYNILIKKFPSGALRITAGSKEETDRFIEAAEKIITNS